MTNPVNTFMTIADLRKWARAKGTIITVSIDFGGTFIKVDKKDFFLRMSADGNTHFCDYEGSPKGVSVYPNGVAYVDTSTTSFNPKDFNGEPK